MSQVPSLTIEYEESRATICPPGCDMDSVVLVQLTHAPQQPPADSDVISNGDLREFPAWPLHATGPGREMG